jgi:hypothetical protein
LFHFAILPVFLPFDKNAFLDSLMIWNGVFKNAGKNLKIIEQATEIHQLKTPG